MTGVSPQPGTGTSSGPAPASQSGSRVKPATAAETARPVTATGGAAAISPKSDGGAVRSAAMRVEFPGEAAEARIEAAQRAYMMTLRAAGVSAMSSRLS